MNWIESNLSYGKNLVESSVEGARSARKMTTEGECVGSVLTRSARDSWQLVSIGVGLGLLVGLLVTRRKPSPAKMLVCGLLGGVAGLGTGVAWETRELTGDMARGAIKNAKVVRDAHWLERHPIDYA
jgi:hypothetical protein